MNASIKIRSNKRKTFSIATTLITIMFLLFSVSGCSKLDYGTKLTFAKTNELYYTDKVTSKEAQALGDYLVKIGIFADDSNTRSVQLNKDGSTYEFRMVVKKGLEQDQTVVEAMKIISLDLSNTIFNGAPVDIHLCDDKFETLRVVISN